MPNLPTFNVSDATANRLLKAFEGRTDAQTGAALTSVQAYRQWLRDNLVSHVRSIEAEKDAATLANEMPL